MSQRPGLLRKAIVFAAFKTVVWSEAIQRGLTRLYLRASGVRHPQKIQTFTQPDELAALFRLGLKCPPNGQALEIGSYLGASACYLGAALAKNNGRLYCVDTWQNETMPDGVRDTYQEFLNNTRAVKDAIVPLRLRSDDLDRGQFAGGLDLVFLDGDHAYEQVKKEIDRFTPLLKPRGVLVFHDSTYHEGVSRAIGELLATGQWAVDGQVQSLLWLRRPNWSADPRG